MDIQNSKIDGGKAFDWGKTSADYARFRDIYPQEFYDNIVNRGLCIKGQRVLDLGTGTGVLPRNLYRFGAEWVGTDIAPEQIEQAKQLAASAGMQIDFRAVSAENLNEPDASFDVITACQCFWYFDHEKVMPELARMLKPGGKIVVLYMAWLPFEDAIAGESERLILQYNPNWTGRDETRHNNWIPDIAKDYFDLTEETFYDIPVRFTRESWHGRMRACRGTGASMSPEVFAQWDADHRLMLEQSAPPEFDVQHFAAITVLTKR